MSEPKELWELPRQMVDLKAPPEQEQVLVITEADIEPLIQALRDAKPWPHRPDGCRDVRIAFSLDCARLDSKYMGRR